MRSTRLFVSVLVLFGLATLPVRAEDPAASTDSLGRPVMAASQSPGPVPAGLSGGKEDSSPWGLEFAVGPNLTLRSAQGNTLSLLRRLDERRRLRMGLSVSGSFEAADTDNSTQTHTPTDSTVNQSRREDETTMGSVGVLVQRQWLGSSTGRVGVLVGLGPELVYEVIDRRSESRRVEYGDPTISTQSGRTTDVSLGLLGSLGSEWRFSRNLALQACYNLKLARSWEWIDQQQWDSYHDGSSTSANHSENLQLGWRLSSSFTFSLSAWF